MNSMEETIRGIVREEVRAALQEYLPVRREGGDVLSIAEAAELARVHRVTVTRWLGDGTLKRLGSGRMTRVRRDDVLALLENGPAQDKPLSPEQMGRNVAAGLSANGKPIKPRKPPPIARGR
jgi:excisionase family DNA binding protein